MTWHPTTNLIQSELLTPEQREALKAWPHGHEYYCLGGDWVSCTDDPAWSSHIVYRGKPVPVVTSVWFNVYRSPVAMSLVSTQCKSRDDADFYAAKDRIDVLRIDTCNGVSTAHLEGLK